MIVVPNKYGEMIPVEKYNIANHLWQMKLTQPFWKVIEEIIKVFRQTQPKRWDSYIIQIEETKREAGVESIGSKRFRGVTKDRSGTKTDGMTNIHQVDMPIWIMLCIRKLYTEVELNNMGYGLSGSKEGKRFFREFGRRFSFFRIHESI